MSHDAIEEINSVSFKSTTQSQWKACLEVEKEERLSSRLLGLAKSVGNFVMTLWEWLLALIIALYRAFGIVFTSGSAAAGSAALTAFDSLIAITSCATFCALAATIHNIGKYNAEAMSDNSFGHHNKRDWRPLNDDAIELDTLS